MRRKSWFKSLASLLAVWFPLVVGEPSLLQPCPTHGASAAVMATGDTAGHASHGMASHGAGVTESSTHQDGGPGNAHHDCTCIAGCCASLATAVAPYTSETFVATLEPARARPYLTADVLPRPAPEFSRPYTTGPPRA